MSEENRRIGKKGFGKYHLLKIKEYGLGYQGLFFVDVPTLKAFDQIPEEEMEKHILKICPFDIPSICFPAASFMLVKGQCQEVPEGHPLRREECDEIFDAGICVFLVRYADTGNFGCRLKLKTDKGMVYEER